MYISEITINVNVLCFSISLFGTMYLLAFIRRQLYYTFCVFVIGDITFILGIDVLEFLQNVKICTTKSSVKICNTKSNVIICNTNSNFITCISKSNVKIL